MIKTNLDKLNSATKYPSILTYHDIGDRGTLKDSVLIPLENAGQLFLTEKIDGTNARIILFHNGYFIGSREDLLTASGDLIYNPSLGIVEAIQSLVPQITVHLGNCVYVLFGEVYGAKIGDHGKNYTNEGKRGFRLFDVAIFNSEYDLEKFLTEIPIEKIASWRDHGGQTFLAECDLRLIAEQSGIPLTPRLSLDKPLPRGINETLEWLKQALPGNTNAPIDGTGGQPEGVVVRTFDRSKIAKLRFEDYERTLRAKR